MVNYKEKRIVIVLAVFLVLVIATAQVTAVSNPYQDVPAKHWSDNELLKKYESETQPNQEQVTQSDTQPYKEQVKQATRNKLSQNAGYHFSSVTSLGTPEVFADTIDGLNIVQSSKGDTNYKDGVLTIPNDFNPNDPAQQTAIYKAVIQAIEDKQNSGGFNSPTHLEGVGRFNTNIEKVETVSGVLREFENSIEKGDSQDQSYKLWKKVGDTWKGLNINSGDQTNPSKQIMPVGITFNFDEIEEFYQSGDAGENFRKFFEKYPSTSTVTPTPLKIDWSDMPGPCIGGDNCYSNLEDSGGQSSSGEKPKGW